MINFFKSIGLTTIENVKPYSYDSGEYDLHSDDDKNKIKAHKEFLKSALDEENNRLIAIESKTNQLVSQTSVVFSLLSLTIPIIIDKTEDADFFVRLILIIFVLVAFAFYFLAIFNALKNFNVKNFNYSVASPSNVIDFKDKTEAEFEAELVRDYLESINVNIATNNKKATNLLHSNTAFKFGNIITASIVILISSLVLFSNKVDEKIEIENAQKVTVPNSKNIVLKVTDTLTIHDTIRITDTIVKTDTIFVKK